MERPPDPPPRRAPGLGHRPYDLAPAPPPPRAPPPATVRGSRTCVRCGYPLEGLPVAGACPECAWPVELSLRGPKLEYSDPAYVVRLHRGVTIVAVAIALSILIMVVQIIGSLVAGVSLRAGLPPAMPTSFDALMLVAHLLVQALSAAGWWLLSAPDPAHVLVDRGTRARQVVRVAVIIQLVAAVLQVAAQQADARQLVPARLADIMGLVSLVAAAIGFFGAMVYLRWLAPRLGDEFIQERARMLMWAAPLLVTVGACVLVGPIAALFLYCGLLNHTRERLLEVRRWQEARAAP
ncbi:MAG TPA: hypothetical protein VD963_06635 [Phycisphaerales bacterium]|nr:hypothetical protein [Phycisphaerales bacterium]